MIQFKYIENTANRYAVSSQGQAFSLYQINKDGSVKLEIRQKTISLVKVGDIKRPKFSGYHLYPDTRPKWFDMLICMQLFMPPPPDNIIPWKLKPKDGNMLNLDISNLEWKKCWRGKYYPEDFYDNKILVARTCCKCGETKPVSKFDFCSGIQRRNYSNTCRACVYEKRKSLPGYQMWKAKQALKEKVRKELAILQGLPKISRAQPKATGVKFTVADLSSELINLQFEKLCHNQNLFPKGQLMLPL